MYELPDLSKLLRDLDENTGKLKRQNITGTEYTETVQNLADVSQAAHLDLAIRRNVPIEKIDEVMVLMKDVTRNFRAIEGTNEDVRQIERGFQERLQCLETLKDKLADQKKADQKKTEAVCSQR